MPAPFRRWQGIALTAGLLAGLTAPLLAAPAGAAPLTRPAVRALSAHHGVWWGGYTITVTGSNFEHVRTVLFDKRRAWGVDVVSPTQLTVLVPSRADGRTDVRVVTAAGRSTAHAADTFTFTPARMTTPIYGGLSARQEQGIAARVVRHHHGVRVLARHAHRWTPAMGLTAVRRARSWLGVPYSWAGGSSRGPTHGVCARNGGDNDCHVVGFDCSGLTMYSWAPYRSLAHYAQSQKGEAGRFHPTIGQLVPGDLVFFSGYIPNGIGHTAIYAGHGTVIQAEQSGTLVMRSKLTDVIANSGTYRGATRPMSTGRQGPGPRVASITRSTPTTGGGKIVITGQQLNRVQSVAFGTTHVYRFVHQSRRRLVVAAPARAAGVTRVLVSTAWGTSRPLRLRYVSPAGTAYTRVATGSAGPQSGPRGTLTPTGDHVGNRVHP